MDSGARGEGEGDGGARAVRARSSGDKLAPRLAAEARRAPHGEDRADGEIGVDDGGGVERVEGDREGRGRVVVGVAVAVGPPLPPATSAASIGGSIVSRRITPSLSDDAASTRPVFVSASNSTSSASRSMAALVGLIDLVATTSNRTTPSRSSTPPSTLLSVQAGWCSAPPSILLAEEVVQGEHGSAFRAAPPGCVHPRRHRPLRARNEGGRGGDDGYQRGDIARISRDCSMAGSWMVRVSEGVFVVMRWSWRRSDTHTSTKAHRGDARRYALLSVLLSARQQTLENNNASSSG